MKYILPYETGQGVKPYYLVELCNIRTRRKYVKAFKLEVI